MKVSDLFDRLIEDGGGTPEGVAEVLAAGKVVGEIGGSADCVLAEWLKALGVPEVNVYPVESLILWQDCDGLRQAELPPILVELARDFDDERLPELAVFLPSQDEDNGYDDDGDYGYMPPWDEIDL